MQVLAGPIGLVVTPEKLELVPGGHAEVSITITNLGSVVDQFDLSVEGVNTGWVTVPHSTVNIYPGDTATLSVGIDLPRDERVPAGTHLLEIKVRSREDPGKPSVAELRIEVPADSRLLLELTPRSVTTRGKARFRVRLTNTGNTEHLLDLQVRDPDDALAVDMTIDRVALPLGASTDIELTVGLRRRVWVAPPHSHAFTLVARPAREVGAAPGEPLAAVDGTVTFHTLLAFLAFRPRHLGRLLMALAALLLLGALAVWFLVQPGVRGALVPRPQPTQVEVPAAVEPTVGGGAPAPEAAAPARALPEPPSIGTFELRVPPDARVGEFELAWEVQGAESVTLAGEPQPAQGMLRIQQPAGGEFVLEATNAGGTTRKAVGVVILRPPEIQQFEAMPQQVQPGQAATLAWRIARGDGATLDGEAVDPTAGTYEVRPDQDTTYLLVAENELGRVEQSTQVRVVAP